MKVSPRLPMLVRMTSELAIVSGWTLTEHLIERGCTVLESRLSCRSSI